MGFDLVVCTLKPAAIAHTCRGILCFTTLVYQSNHWRLCWIWCISMKRQTLLPSLLWSCLVPRVLYRILNIKLTNIFFPLCYDDWNGMVGIKLHCQGWPERLDVLLQVVQERWNWLVSCLHQPHTSDPFIHLEEKSNTSVYSDSLSHFGKGAIILLKQRNISFIKKNYWYNWYKNLLCDTQ